jgi:hypothetical protein
MNSPHNPISKRSSNMEEWNDNTVKKKLRQVEWDRVRQKSEISQGVSIDDDDVYVMV